jgi:hypothetical protein
MMPFIRADERSGLENVLGKFNKIFLDKRFKSAGRKIWIRSL